MEGAAPSELLPRRFDQTKAVVKQIKSFEDLNAPTAKESEANYAKALGEYINSSAINGEFAKGCMMKLYDDKKRRLPVVLKIPNPYVPVKLKNIQEAHLKHVELLGPKYVEDMTLIEITSPRLLSIIKERNDNKPSEAAEFPEIVVGYAQDLRGKEEFEDIYTYVVENNENMSVVMKEAIIKFLDRMEDAINQGWGLDMGTDFPDSLETPDQVSDRRRNTNIFVDDEGPSFIDSGTMRWFPGEGRGLPEGYLLGIALSRDLLRKKISLDEAFKKMRDYNEEHRGAYE